MTYLDSLVATKNDLIKELSQRGIQNQYLVFGGEGKPPDRAPRIPTDARSQFLANRAMGDWAEYILADAIRRCENKWIVAHYGNAQRIAAGENGFKEFYLTIMEEVRKYGKRPDLLLFPYGSDVSEDLTDLSCDVVDEVVRQSIAAIEVRSSKFEALKYMSVRQKERKVGKKSARQTPNFTVKVEDLKIVFRWIERYACPQSYCQVFFDSIFCINFLDIFTIVASGNGFTIEKPEKS